jgi:hypothetical protein
MKVRAGYEGLVVALIMLGVAWLLIAVHKLLF